MNINDVALKTVKYKFEQVTISVGSTNFEVDPTMVGDVYIEKDYENTVLPYFQMRVNVPNWLYRQMKKDSQNIKVGFTLKYALFTDVSSNANVTYTTDLSGKFYGIIPESGSDSYEEQYSDIERADKTLNSGYTYNEYSVIDIMLLNEIYYKGLNKVCNQVFSSITPAGALTYVLNQGSYNSILLSPPNNNKTYSQFKVTPLSLIDQVKRICYDYNLHSNGTTIFFDLNRGYIIDKQPKCTAFMTNEYKTTYITSFSQSDRAASTIAGVFMNHKEKYNLFNVVEGTYSFKNTTNVENTANIQVIDTTTGSVASSSTGTSGITKIYTYSGGSNSASQVAKSISEQSTILTLSTTDVVLSFLNPNKEFIFYSDSTKATTANVNGSYRITKMVCNLSKNGEFWLPATSAEFRK